MKKDRLYFLTFLAIAVIFLLIASIAVQYFIKASANQLIEIQVESSKREANEIAKFLDYQLSEGISKEALIKNTQKVITDANKDTWFLSVFDWSGKEICHPDITKVGLKVNSNQRLLASLEEKNNSDDLYEILLHINSKDQKTSEIIYISPLKNADLIVAAHVNKNSIASQMKTLKTNFYLIFLIMGFLIILLSFVAVRFIGSAYEKQLEVKNSTLTSEVVNLSKLNTDLISYKEKVIEVATEKEDSEEILDKSKQRILTYVRNELVPIAIKEIAYIYRKYNYLCSLFQWKKVYLKY